jgi:hypothetical protein
MGATAIQLPDFDVFLGSLWPPLIRDRQLGARLEMED